MSRPIYLGLLLLALTFSAACGTTDAPDSAVDVPRGALVGSLAPDFTLQTMSGEEVTLSHLRGKPVFLNFWASWCGPCQNEMPQIQALSREYEGKVHVLGINSTSEDDPENAKHFAGRHGLTFRNVMDVDGKAKIAYGALGLPVSLLLDADGKIVQRIQGELSAEKMRTWFASVAK